MRYPAMPGPMWILLFLLLALRGQAAGEYEDCLLARMAGAGPGMTVCELRSLCASEYRYLGYGDARAVYILGKHTFALMARPGTEKFSLETSWSYPISSHVRFMLYYFNGNGETLLDYDKKSDRFVIGFSINDCAVNK